MKPLLKWAGGKRHIASTLETHLPSDWAKGMFYEPFLGGAAMFFHLEPKKATLSDVNAALIAFYRDLRDHPEELFSGISNLANHFDAMDEGLKTDFYLQLREEFNSLTPTTRKSELFYALNKLCFNGLYRENSKGKFNVPFGKKKSFPILSLPDFLEAADRLMDVKLETSDFEHTARQARAGDFIYFDPPYIPIDSTSNFTSYSSGGFDLSSQERLASLMKTLRDNGVKAMLSNSSTPLTVETYSGLRQVAISAPRMVSAKSSGRGRIDELIIMNY